MTALPVTPPDPAPNGAIPTTAASAPWPGAILHEGIWLPPGETHLQTIMSPGAKRFQRDRHGRACYQAHKLDAAMAFVPPGRRRVAVDVGAHVGLWSMRLVDLFYQVIAFEPLTVHRALFFENVRVDRAGRCILHGVALGRAEGGVEIASTTPGSSGDSHVVGDGDIPVRTLDSFDLPVVDFLKIDVEGMELEVCEGAVETLKRCRPVVVIEQKGKEVEHFRRVRDEARGFLDWIGMRDLCPPISGDHVMGWP